MPSDIPAVAAIRNRPCPSWCSRPGHRYTADRLTPWDMDRTHRVDFPLIGRRAMVTVESYDEYVANALRGSDAPDEDYVGTPSVSVDERFQLDGGTAGEARRLAARVQILVDQLLVAADRLDEVRKG